MAKVKQYQYFLMSRLNPKWERSPSYLMVGNLGKVRKQGPLTVS